MKSEDVDTMNKDAFWPSSDAFLDICRVEQLTDGRARCTGVAVCDDEGMPVKIFRQGEKAHFFYEFEVLKEVTGVLSGGLEFHDASGTIIHGKNTFQYEDSVIEAVTPGNRLRYHHSIKLDVAPGEYWFTIGLGYSDETSYAGYKKGLLSHDEFGHSTFELCRATNAGSFEVRFATDDKLLHYGMADLPSSIYASVGKIADYRPPMPANAAKADNEIPTIFHITHWKAGSQWIYKILRQCSPDLIVPAEVGQDQFLYWPIRAGKVYPTLYITKEQFDAVCLPKNWRRFVIIRDLRDTLISSYFSFKISHPVLEPGLAKLRGVLNSLTFDDGLIYLMDGVLSNDAKIQLSWLESGERLIRYKDLLEQDLEILEPLLIDECRLPVSHERLREAVVANRFENLANGRKRGEEDVKAHERKGVYGDWRNHFNERVKAAFKARYGGLLVATGYERNLDW
jgi:Wzt C-terminal domain